MNLLDAYSFLGDGYRLNSQKARMPPYTAPPVYEITKLHSIHEAEMKDEVINNEID